MFCSQIFTLKSNIRPKIGLTYVTVKDFLGFFVKENIFLLFFPSFELLMFHNNIVKFSEKLNKRNLLQKYASKFPILQISA